MCVPVVSPTPPESGLQLDEPEHDGTSVDYLDMTIRYDADSQLWHSKLYDKKIAMIAGGLKLNNLRYMIYEHT